MGKNGIGKSYTIYETAKALAAKYDRKFTTKLSEIDEEHFFLLDRRLTYMNPTDILGVLYKDNGVSKWHYPDWLWKISKEREEKEGIEIKGIVSLEEMNLAPPLVQNAAYELVLEYRVQDLEIADGVVFIAAGNVNEDRAYTYEMPDPLKTRFTHVELKVPVFRHPTKKEGWFYWAAERGIDGRILSFLSYREDLLFSYMEDVRVFPTPRGWEKASKLMKGKPDKVAWRAVAKACGTFAGEQFRQFMELSTKVDVEEMLNKPEKFLELDAANKFAAISAMTSMFSKAPEIGEKLLKFAAHLFTGIYNGELREYMTLLERYTSTRDESTAETLRKMKGKERQPEFAVLILTNMKAHNREATQKIVQESVYGNVLVDVLPFLV